MNPKIMKQAGFKTSVDLVNQGKCPFCEKDVDIYTEFKDKLSKKEYYISGLCQACQDGIFTELEEE